MRPYSANRDAMRRFTIKIGNSINKNWPQKDLGKTITIQMDNATLHLQNDDPTWVEAKKDWLFDIQLICQLP